MTNPSPSNRNNNGTSCDAEEQEFEIFLEGDTVTFVHDDDLYEFLAPLFSNITTTRASHVEPLGNQGMWGVDVSPTTGEQPHIKFTCARRDQALATEKEWVLRHLRGEE